LAAALDAVEEQHGEGDGQVDDGDVAVHDVHGEGSLRDGGVQQHAEGDRGDGDGGGPGDAPELGTGATVRGDRSGAEGVQDERGRGGPVAGGEPGGGVAGPVDEADGPSGGGCGGVADEPAGAGPDGVPGVVEGLGRAEALPVGRGGGGLLRGRG